MGGGGRLPRRPHPRPPAATPRRRLLLDKVLLARSGDEQRAHLVYVRHFRARARAARRATCRAGLRSAVDLQVAAEDAAAIGGEPAIGAARSLPTAAITETPRARHSRTVHRPWTPPRSSRRASRIASIRRTVRDLPGRKAARRHLPVRETDLSVAARRQVRLMGDQQQRGAGLAAGRTAGPSPPRRCLVEVAGRLVRQQQARPGAKARARATRCCSPPESCPGRWVRRWPSPTASSAAARSHGVAPAGEFQRHGDILQRRHRRDEMEGLEHDADGLSPQAGQRVLVHRA